MSADDIDDAIIEVSTATTGHTSNAWDSAKADTLLSAAVKLGMVLNSVLTQLFSPSIVALSWKTLKAPSRNFSRTYLHD